MALVAFGLGACASLDPLGSPAKQQRGEGGPFEADFPVQAGYICRELRGQADVDAFQGQGQGGRCQHIGEGKVEGCFRFSSDRVEFESSGCFEGPTSDPEKINKLGEQLDALEAEFEAFLKGEK